MGHSKKSKRDKKGREIPIPPELPPQERAPWINIYNSDLAQSSLNMLSSAMYSDVLFVLEDGTRMRAHKVSCRCR